MSIYILSDRILRIRPMTGSVGSAIRWSLGRNAVCAGETEAIQARLFELPRALGADAAETHVTGSRRHRAEVFARSGRLRVSRQPNSLADLDLDLAAASTWPGYGELSPDVRRRGQVRIIDLFSGCGALTLGVVEACRALQLEAVPVIAVDTNASALDVYKANFPTAETSNYIGDRPARPKPRRAAVEQRA